MTLSSFWIAPLTLPFLFQSAALAQLKKTPQGPTFIQAQAQKMVRPVQLDRLTFGPDDNYQPAPFADGKTLLFTRKEHMNPVLEILDIQKRELKSWRTNVRDVDSASVHPKTGQVVFRSLERNPDGEICTTTELSESIRCLKTLSGEKSSPFWIDKDKVGFVRKERGSSQVSLDYYNIDTEKTQSLSRDRLFHPSASQDGGRLAWVARTAGPQGSQQIQYAAFENGTLGETCTPRVSWPGISAYPRFSADNRYLIFTHYLSDTNHDGRIDGEDNSILARITVPQKGCNNDLAFPEPLTSLNENCSQPGINGSSLVIACAFEGSLDLYQMPDTGVIPTSWGEAGLLAAHASARTPEDRQLYLLSLISHHTPQSQTPVPTLFRGVFAQSLLMQDEAGARAWLRELDLRSAGLTSKEKETFEKVLAAGIARRAESAGEVSVTLRMNLEKYLKAIAGDSMVGQAAIATVHSLINEKERTSAIEKALLAAALKKPDSDLSFLYFSHVWDRLAKSAGLDEGAYQKALAQNKELSESGQLIYWAKSLERMEKSPQRQALLQKAQGYAGLPAVQKLLQLEKLAIAVEKNEDKAYANYDKVLLEVREQGLLVRLAAYRAIHLWSAADRLKEVEFVTANLFKYVPAQSLEATYAKDYFISTSFDRGYDYVRANNPMAALGHFYGALTMTDSDEARWGYLVNMIAAGREGLIERNIQDLKKRNFINESEPLTRLYADLARRKTALPENPKAWLAQVERAEPHPDAFASFLRGSVRLQWVLETPALKEDESREALDTARVELILAMDGARDNQRLKAQALTNLGILGSRTRLWGPAQKWWQERLELPFDSEEAKNLASYLRAQALLGLQDYHQAADVVEKINVSKDSPLFPAVHHLKVQTAAFSGNHLEVLKLTQGTPPDLRTLNGLKQGLLRGRSLLAVPGQGQSACATLSEVEKGFEALPESRRESISGADPRRLRLIGGGFLARCETGTPTSVDRLTGQMTRLQISEEDRKAIGLHEVTFLENRLKTQLRLWQESGSLANDSVTSFLKDIEAHRLASGQLVNLGQFEALYGLGSLSLTQKGGLDGNALNDLKSRIDSFLGSARKSLSQSDLLNSQQIRLEALRWKLDGLSAEAFANKLKAHEGLKSLEGRNAFLASKTRLALEWMQALR